jgi:hypothetical protein
MVIDGCSTLCGHQCLLTALDHSNADHLNIIFKRVSPLCDQRNRGQLSEALGLEF